MSLRLKVFDIPTNNKRGLDFEVTSYGDEEDLLPVFLAMRKGLEEEGLKARVYLSRPSDVEEVW